MLNSQIVSQPKLIHGIFFLLESQFSKVGPSAFVLNTFIRWEDDDEGDEDLNTRDKLLLVEEEGIILTKSLRRKKFLI